MAFLHWGQWAVTGVGGANFLKQLELSYDPAIPRLGIYPTGWKIGTQTDICTQIFIATLRAIAKKVETTQVPTDG